MTQLKQWLLRLRQFVDLSLRRNYAEREGLQSPQATAEGAGKSAILNSLIGHPILPIGGNGATRAPIRIDINKDSSLSGQSILLLIDSKSQEVSASALRHSLQNRLSQSVTRDEIYLKLRTGTAPPLKLIDLPGSDQRIMDDSMISKYVEHNDAILLVIIPATQTPEVSSSRALRIAKEHHADSTRTIGIISKMDQAEGDSKALSAVQALLSNQGPPKKSDIPWVAVIGQSVAISSVSSGGAAAESSLEAAWRAEVETLKRLLTGAPQNKLRRVALVDSTAGQIRNRTSVRLPNLLSRRHFHGNTKENEPYQTVTVLFDKDAVGSVNASESGAKILRGEGAFEQFLRTHPLTAQHLLLSPASEPYCGMDPAKYRKLRIVTPDQIARMQGKSSILFLDLGKKKTGACVICRGFGTFGILTFKTKDLPTQLKDLIKEYRPMAIVVGVSRNHPQDPTPCTNLNEMNKEYMEKMDCLEFLHDIPIAFLNEYGSTGKAILLAKSLRAFVGSEGGDFAKDPLSVTFGPSCSSYNLVDMLSSMVIANSFQKMFGVTRRFWICKELVVKST